MATSGFFANSLMAEPESGVAKVARIGGGEITVALVSATYVAVALLFTGWTRNIVLVKTVAMEIGMAVAVSFWLGWIAWRGGGHFINVPGGFAVVYLSFLILRSAFAGWSYAAWIETAWLAPMLLLVPLLGDALRSRRAAFLLLAAIAFATFLSAAYLAAQALGLSGWNGQNIVMGFHGNFHFASLALFPPIFLLAAVGVESLFRRTPRAFLVGVFFSAVSVIAVVAMIMAVQKGPQRNDVAFSAPALNYRFEFVAFGIGISAMLLLGVFAHYQRFISSRVASSVAILVATLLILLSHFLFPLTATARAQEIHAVIARGAERLATENPFGGVGPGAFTIEFPRVRESDYRRKGVSHNTIYAFSEPLAVWAEGGFVGLFTWILLLGSLLWEAAAAVANGTKRFHRALGLGCFGALVSTLAFSLHGNAMRLTGPAFAFWTLAGITAGIRGIDLPPTKGTWSVNHRRLVLAAAALVFLSATGTALYIGGRAMLADHYAMELSRHVDQPSMDSIRIALRAGEKAIRLNPYDKSTYYQMAYLHLKQSDFADALAYYRRIQRLAPNYAQIHTNLAYVLAAMGDTKASLAETILAAQMEDNVINHRAAAYALIKAGQFAEARKHWEAILRIPADDTEGLGTIPGYGHAEAREWLRRTK